MNLDDRIRKHADRATQEFSGAEIPGVAGIHRRRRRGDGLRMVAALVAVLAATATIVTMTNDRSARRATVATQNNAASECQTKEVPPPRSSNVAPSPASGTRSAPTTTTTPHAPATGNRARPDDIVTLIDGDAPNFDHRVVALDGDGSERETLFQLSPTYSQEYMVYKLPDGRVATFSRSDEGPATFKVLGTNIKKTVGIEASLAPDGHTIVSTVSDGKTAARVPGLEIDDLFDPSVHRTIPTSELPQSPVWAKDGKTILVPTTNDKLLTIDATTGRTIRSVGFDSRVLADTFGSGWNDTLADGRMVVSRVRPGRERFLSYTEVDLVDPQTGATQTLVPDTLNAWWVNVDRSGSRILYANGDWPSGRLCSVDATGRIEALAGNAYKYADW